ncbi:Pentapeptide repeats (8 copies) [compost metagenome]
MQLDFSDADLAGSDFRDTVFHGGSLRNANLKNVRFEGADLREVDLSGIDLTVAARLAGATISKAQAAVLLAELRISVI